MDTTKFDAVARLFGNGMTRREALRGLVAGAAAITAGGVLLQGEEVSAKKRKKTCKRVNCQPGFRCVRGKCKPTARPTDRGLAEGSPCSTDGQCRATENLVCDVPPGASNSDTKCCRGTGASCSASTPCCTGEAGTREFQCVAESCQPYVQP